MGPGPLPVPPKPIDQSYERHDPTGRTKPGASWTDADGNFWFEPSGLTPEEQRAKDLAAAAGNKFAPEHSEAFGDYLGQLSDQASPFVTVDHSQIDRARQLAAQSYGQQQQALGLMQAQAMGQGPSVASLQGQTGQDQAVAQMMGAGPNGLHAAYAAGFGNQAASQAAGARGEEIAQAQQGWAQGAQQMRGQSLQDYQQALQSAGQAKALSMQQQQQDMERRLQLERMRLGAYGAATAQRNSLAGLYAGQYVDELDREQMRNAALGQGISSGIAGAEHLGSGIYNLFKDDEPNKKKGGT